MERHELQYTVQNLKNIIPYLDSPQEALEACWMYLRDEQLSYYAFLRSEYYKIPEGYGGALYCKNKGNEYFYLKNFRQALLFYNDALCKALPGSELIGQLYANRAAVYLECKYFSLCLENIEMARENNYPRANLPKLEKREKRCLEAMQATEDENKASSKPLREIKLSFPAQQKNPMLVEGIKASLSNNGVIELRAERDFAVGDVIIDDSHLMLSFYSRDLIDCQMCAESNLMSLKPCTGCMYAMFCSKECEERAMKEFHRLECASLEGLYNLYHTKKLWKPRVATQALVRILSMYPNLDRFRQQIALWRTNPSKIFEDNDQDPELLQIKLLFIRKLNVSMDKMIDHGIAVSDLLAFLLQNPRIAARINSREDEFLALEILFTVSNSLPNNPPPTQVHTIINFFKFTHGDSKTSNVNIMVFPKKTFYYASRPIKKDQMIVVDSVQALPINPTAKTFLEIIGIEPLPPTEHRFVNLDIIYEYNQLMCYSQMKFNKDFLLDSERRYKTILKKFAQHWPCKELVEVRYLYVTCMNIIHNDMDRIAQNIKYGF